MRPYLLDTHAALFWWAGAAKLGGNARAVISNPDATILVSAASAWEVATKFRLGKLGDIGDPMIHFPRLVSRHGFVLLDITSEHGLRAGSLTGAHRDPFDRLIAAQGLIEGATVVTRDRELAAFGCEVLW